MERNDVPEGVGRTAIGMALVRAAESDRPDRLFEDPYAAAFVAAAPDAFAEDEAAADVPVLSALGAVFAFAATIRTRFYDDYLAAACAAGARQVVLLAAGLDTRAFRLPWPSGVVVYELDLPEVLAFKDRVLRERGASPGCTRRVAAVDLRDDWRPILLAAGLDPTMWTAWLIEGLLAYLTASEAAVLLTTVTDLSTPGSSVAFERGAGASTSLIGRARSMPSMARYTSMFRGGLGDDARAWLTRHGWDPHERDRLELAAEYGRAAPPDSAGGLVTATRVGV